MSIHQPAAILQGKAQIHAAPVLRRNRHQRVFDLHPAVHVMLAGAWLLFVGMLCAAFMGQNLVIPAAINVIGVVGLFLVPAFWSRVVPDDGLPRQSWDEFLAEGVETYTGHLPTREALAQIFILPVLLLSLAGLMVIIKMSL